MKKSFGGLVFIIGLIVAALIAAFLIYFYLNSPNVDNKSWGGPAEFGQFGDMIGGILNPVFALISVILLLLTYAQALKNSEIEHQRVEREEIRNVINETKSTLNALKEKRSFKIPLNDEGTPNNYIYFSMRDCFDENNANKDMYTQRLRDIQSQLEKENPLDISGTVFEKSHTARIAFKNNYYEFSKIKVITNKLLDLQLDYLKTQKSKSLSNLMSLDTHNVLEDAFKTIVLSKNEYHSYIERVISTHRNKM